MRRYQAVLILHPDIEDAALEDFQKGFNKLLKSGKAADVRVLENDKRDLAHPIKKIPRAHFWRVAFDAPPGLISKLQDEIRHDERLLRQVYLNLAARSEEAVEEIPAPSGGDDREAEGDKKEKEEKEDKEKKK